MLADAPFVDRPVGDESAARRVAERLATRLGSDRPVLVRAAMNATYTSGDTVIRVGRTTAPGESAYRLADVLGDAGVRVATPAGGRLVEEADGLTATAWQRITPVDRSIDWHEVGTMVRRLHDLDPAVVDDYPVPPAMSLPWWRLDTVLETARPHVDPPAFAGLAAAAERLRGWEHEAPASTWVLCHGDVHPHNVVAGPDGPVILDWDLLCVAPAAWDFAPLRAMVDRWGIDATWYEDFSRGAGGDAGDVLVERLTEGRLVAATLMRVIAEGETMTPDSEASRRLRWWRGDPAAPVWTVV